MPQSEITTTTGIGILAALDRGRAALAEATENWQRLHVRDQARAAAEAAKVLGYRDIHVAATELMARAERAIVQANPPLKRGPKAGEEFRRPGGEIIPHQRISDMRKVHTPLTDDAFEAAIAKAKEDGTSVTRSLLRGRAHVGRATGEVEWYTPQSILVCVRSVMGGIDCDPASSAVAQEAVKAETHYTAADDGLAQEWHGRVFLNPPYATGLVEAFAQKLLEELDAGHTTAAIALTNNATETAWGQALLRAARVWCFPAGRVRFETPAGVQGTPLQGQMILGFGPALDVPRFQQAFREIGTSVCA